MFLVSNVSQRIINSVTYLIISLWPLDILHIMSHFSCAFKVRLVEAFICLDPCQMYPLSYLEVQIRPRHLLCPGN